MTIIIIIINIIIIITLMSRWALLGGGSLDIAADWYGNSRNPAVGYLDIY